MINSLINFAEQNWTQLKQIKYLIDLLIWILRHWFEK